MIEVRNLCKVYGETRAVGDVSFDVAQGEIVGFLGPNGAGKTTTMRILACYMPATSGTASIDGFDTFENSLDVRRRIGYLPENPPLYPEMTVTSYLKFCARLRKLESSREAAQLAFVIERCGLEEVTGRILGNLSKGYRQRVGLAQALIHDPPVLILDEPTVGLDPRQIREIRGLIRELGKDRTVILSTHILPEVQALCKRVIIIHRGRIAAEDTLESLSTGMSGPRVRIVVGDKAAEAETSLTDMKTVREVRRDGNSLDLELAEDSNDLRALLVRTLVQKDIPVLEVGSPVMSLEEIFVRVTAEDIAEMTTEEGAE